MIAVKRNFRILVIIWIIFVGVTAFMSELLPPVARYTVDASVLGSLILIVFLRRNRWMKNPKLTNISKFYILALIIAVALLLVITVGINPLGAMGWNHPLTDPTLVLVISSIVIVLGLLGFYFYWKSYVP